MKIASNRLEVRVEQGGITACALGSGKDEEVI